MRRLLKPDDKQLTVEVDPAWRGNVKDLVPPNQIPEGYNLARVKRTGRKYVFTYTKGQPQ